MSRCELSTGQLADVGVPCSPGPAGALPRTSITSGTTISFECL
jgi:hypothetical protein